MLKNKIIAVALSATFAVSLSGIVNNQAYAADTTLQVTTPQKVQAEGFKDMTNAHWSYDSVLWGQAEGMISGYPDGTFKPNKEVTEAEFLAMLIRSIDVAGEVKPASDRNWSQPYYFKAKALNYPVTGKQNESITRTTVAELVTSTRGVNYSGQQAIQYMLGNKLSKGKIAATIEGYKGSDLLTRAEAVQFLRNVVDMVDVIGLMERPTQPSDSAELPKLPEVKPVENNTDAKLEVLRKQIEKVMSKDGYSVRASSHEFSVIIANADGKGFASYSDYRATGGVRTAQVEKVIKLDLTIDMEKLNVTAKMLQAAGIPVDNKLTDTMVDVIGGANGKTVEYGAFKVWITRVGTTLIMTIE